MKIKTILTSLLLGTWLTFSGNSFAAAPDLSAGSVSGFPGQSVTVPIVADFSVPVGSSQFTLKYDPNLLTITGVTIGAANTGWTIVDNPNTPGTVIVGMFSTAGTPISGTAQTIANINFTVNATPGTPTLTAPNLDLSSAVFDTATVTALTNGEFTLGLLGNPTGSGKVSVADALLVAQDVVGITTLTPFQQTEAEVDGTTTVNIYDAFLIAEYTAGIITKL